MVEIKKIGEVAEVKGGKRLPKGSALVATRNNHPYLRVVDFSNGSIDASNLQYVPSKVFPQIARYIISSNDIYISIVGTVGLVGTVPEYLDGASLTENAAKICNLSNNVNQKYLAYYLQSNAGQAAIQSQTVGSTQPKLALFRIKDIEFPAPPISEQISIASVLGALDEKIENNRQMNETLEEMAQAIFKSWFVDFDPVHAKVADTAPTHMDADTAALFPSSFGDDGLPKGWQIKQIEEVAEQVAMGPFGSNIKVSTFVDTGIPIISGKHLNEILLEDKDYNFITEEHANALLRSNVYREDIVFTHAGNVGQVSIIPETSKYERYVLSQRGFYLRCDKSQVSSKYLVHFFKSHLGQHLLLANVSSTGVPSIARPSSYLKSIKFCLPSMPVLNAFDELVISLHLKVSANKNENKTLAELRDTLLKKLMSGEIRVKDAEQEVEAAV